MTTSEASTRRRVKLYMLNEERQWDDKGTGHVSALYTEQNIIALVVISENDGSCLLESKIQPETAYQKQQETLIVWSEGDSMDLALSFQEKAGCDDIWEKICRVQGKDPSVEITQDVVDEPDEADEVDPYMGQAQPLSAFELPPCEFSRLEDISELVNSHYNTLHKRERLIHNFDVSNYFRQLIDLFHKAEDLEDMTSLHHLYEIFRQLLYYNKQYLFELLFSEEMIMDVIGILEYNPVGRTRHRDFLRNQANFREVLPINNPDIVNKIHQTYRIQYVQDCCLPPPGLFDEPGLTVFKTLISVNKMEIIGALQEDNECMQQLFSCLKSPETSASHRRDLALFVKEFCTLSVQTDQKENFLNCLSAHGALSTVEVLLTYSDRDVKSAALEILQVFVENQPSVVREHVLRDGGLIIKRDEAILVNLMIMHLLTDPDPELGDAYQLGYMLRILIDPDNMNNAGGRSEKTDFLSFFYKRCIGTLTKPLFDSTAHERPSNDNYHSALILSNVLELLTFCIESHTYHMKNYCLHRDLVKRVLVLLRSTHKFLVLSALRLLRRVVQMKEEFYNRYLIKNHLFKPVVELFVENGHRYNMIDSAIIELFEYIQSEDISSLVTHVVKEYWDVLSDVNYVHTFKKLKERYDASQRPRVETTSLFGQQSASVIPPLRAGLNSHFHRAAAQQASSDFDDDEQWFNQDDEEDAQVPPPVTVSSESDDHQPPMSTGEAPTSSENIPPAPLTFSTAPRLPEMVNCRDAGDSSSSDSSSDNDSPPKSRLPYALLAPVPTIPSSLAGANSALIGPSPPPSISIHIKSTSLAAEGEQEDKRSGTAIKRQSGTDHDDEDESSSFEGPSPSKHSRLTENEEKDQEDSETKSKEAESTEASGSPKNDTASTGSGLVGLVDYSDGESDEEQEEGGESTNASSKDHSAPVCEVKKCEDPKITPTEVDEGDLELPS